MFVAFITTFGISFAKRSQCWHSSHGRRKGGRKGLTPTLECEICSKNGYFFSFEWEKNTFHHFWPHLEKILEKSSCAPTCRKSFRRPWFQHIIIYAQAKITCHRRFMIDWIKRSSKSTNLLGQKVQAIEQGKTSFFLQEIYIAHGEQRNMQIWQNATIRRFS